MKRLAIAVAVLGLVMFAAPVRADEHDAPPSLEPHPHMLVRGIDFEIEGTLLTINGFTRCVDLAANRAVPLNAHHVHLHVGESGVSGLAVDDPDELFRSRSGLIVLPTAPFPAPFDDPLPWDDCAGFGDILPLTLDLDEE